MEGRVNLTKSSHDRRAAGSCAVVWIRCRPPSNVPVMKLWLDVGSIEVARPIVKAQM
jgi:hypothetical protein